MTVISRFAPAPTGYLHLGHVLNALHVWGVTHAARGRVLVRIEDHDRQRSRLEYERALLDDLEWLGFAPDAAPGAVDGAASGLSRQRDRGQFYEEALERLRSAGLVYACACSRSDAQHGSTADDAPAGERRYAGRCADKDLAWTAGRGLRVRLAPSTERFDDLRHGSMEQQPWQQSGDMLVRDRHGNWTYQFAVTVDDAAQGVNLVVRGDDLLSSTGRQIQLARLLGRAVPPRFLHHGLLMKSRDQKLSKADRDTSVRDLRAAGASADDIIGCAMRAAGLTGRDAPMTRAAAQALIAARYVTADGCLRDPPRHA